jgi:hypothetical protein
LLLPDKSACPGRLSYGNHYRRALTNFQALLSHWLLTPANSQGETMADLIKKMEQYEKRFGVIAVEMGFITREDLNNAIKIQIMEEILDERHRLLGAILLEEGKITTEQIVSVLEQQGDPHN